MKAAAILLILMAAGCTMEGELGEGLPEIAYCTDTRDGEKFSFRTDRIHDIRVGIVADTCFSVTDTKNQFRRLCSSQETFMKCGANP